MTGNAASPFLGQRGLHGFALNKRCRVLRDRLCRCTITPCDLSQSKSAANCTSFGIERPARRRRLSTHRGIKNLESLCVEVHKFAFTVVVMVLSYFRIRASIWSRTSRNFCNRSSSVPCALPVFKRPVEALQRERIDRRAIPLRPLADDDGGVERTLPHQPVESLGTIARYIHAHFVSTPESLTDESLWVRVRHSPLRTALRRALRNNASAIWLRAALWAQRNRMLGLFILQAVLPIRVIWQFLCGNSYRRTDSPRSCPIRHA